MSTITYGTSDASSQKRAGASGCESAVRIPRPADRSRAPIRHARAAARRSARSARARISSSFPRDAGGSVPASRSSTVSASAASAPPEHSGAAAPRAAPPSHALATNPEPIARWPQRKKVCDDTASSHAEQPAKRRPTSTSSYGPSAFDVQRSWAPFSVSPHAATATLRSASSQPSFGSVTIALRSCRASESRNESESTSRHRRAPDATTMPPSASGVPTHVTDTSSAGSAVSLSRTYACTALVPAAVSTLPPVSWWSTQPWRRRPGARLPPPFA